MGRGNRIKGFGDWEENQWVEKKKKEILDFSLLLVPNDFTLKKEKKSRDQKAVLRTATKSATKGVNNHE